MTTKKTAQHRDLAKLPAVERYLAIVRQSIPEATAADCITYAVGIQAERGPLKVPPPESFHSQVANANKGESMLGYPRGNW